MSDVKEENTGNVKAPLGELAAAGESGRAGLAHNYGRLGRGIFAYGLAAAIIVYLARGVSFGQFAGVLRHADAWRFLLASVASLLIWFFGETILYSKLFSTFHGPTSFREMLPANAAQYFLQAVNQVAGGTALVLIMRRRKGVPIFSGGATLVFLALIDFLVMALMGLAAAVFVPHSWLGPMWYYPAALTAGLCLIAGFWLRGRPSSTLLRWVYDRPSLEAFRRARLSQYLRLMLIRAPIFAAQGFALYYQLLSFGVHAPLIQVLAFEPVELFLSAVPITPAGLGVLQAVLILGFHAYATRAALLTMGLAMSSVGVLMRLPFGIGATGSLAREVLRAGKGAPLTAPAE